MRQHVTIVGLLHIAAGALWSLAAIIVAIVLLLIVPFVEDVGGQVVLIAVGVGVPLLLLVLSVPRIVGGIWLVKYRPWARYLVMFMSAINLVNVPVGTAIGVYSLWVLAQEETAQLFAGRSS